MKKRVIVAGGGASGLMAAIFAARSGAAVTVLEAMERPGKKLLLTGNGRCNLTNTDPDLPLAYYGSGAEMAEEIIRRFDADAVRSFFGELGLLTQEKNGYVYPYTAQSVSVLEALLTELRRLKVKMKYSEKVTDIRKKENVWTVTTSSWHYEADSVILACGSKAVPSTGSDGSGYVLAARLGHRLVPAAPALTAILCRESFLPLLAGVRCRARVSLFTKKKDGSLLCEKQDSGELQWTKNGVSGIVVFQLSRFIRSSSEHGSQYLQIDFLPEFETPYLAQLIRSRAQQLSGEKASVLLTGILNDRLIPVILKCAGLTPKTACEKLTDPETLTRLLQTVKQFSLTVSGTKSFDACQVCSGGVDAAEMNHRTLESRKHKNIYFAGEMVDVDGPCGGYNLQWAWSSGYTAGRAAAESID
ncbi:MAG: NAD(P)/FAD-dependent oxidoreductase [Candidatus Choladocola sp.]|nr:NAD(P)/FAD-dependent oxidoreductase [Candidatus Choladocola sp.]